MDPLSALALTVVLAGVVLYGAYWTIRKALAASRREAVASGRSRADGEAADRSSTLTP